MPDISIIIPTYNAEKNIGKCLESIISQDPKGFSIECLIVNDCSTDNGMAIAENAIAAYQGPISFQIISHASNLGVSAARNTGVARATGKYILFIDSDDYLLPGSIMYFADNMALYPDADVIVGGFRENEDGKSFFGHMDKPSYITDANIFTKLLLNGDIYTQSWNKLTRKSILADNNISFIENVIYEDIPWCYYAFSHAKAVLLLPCDTYVYNYVETSLVHSIFNQDKAEKAIRSCAIVANDMLGNPPTSNIFSQSILVEYLLCIAIPLNQGVDVLLRTKIPSSTKKEFRTVRLRLLSRSVAYGRYLVALFLLFMFSPLCQLQKLRYFRRNYYRLQQAVRQISHKMDFIHH